MPQNNLIQAFKALQLSDEVVVFEVLTFRVPEEFHFQSRCLQTLIERRIEIDMRRPPVGPCHRRLRRAGPDRPVPVRPRFR